MGRGGKGREREGMSKERGVGTEPKPKSTSV